MTPNAEEPNVDTVTQSYSRLRRENPCMRAAEALTLARQAGRALAEGFRVETLPGGRVAAVWGGAVWAWSSPAARRNDAARTTHRDLVLLANGLVERDHVVEWRSSGWFGFDQRGFVRGVARRGLEVLERRSQPRWLGARDVEALEILRGIDAALAWTEIRSVDESCGDPVL